MGCFSLVVQVVISPPVPLTIEETRRVCPLYNARVLSPWGNPQAHSFLLGTVPQTTHSHHEEKTDDKSKPTL